MSELIYQTLLASVLFFVAFAVRYFMIPLDKGSAFLTFYPALFLCLFLCGFRIGLAFLVISLIAGAIFLYPPGQTLEDVLDLAFYLITGLLAGGVIRKLRQDEQRYVALLNDQIDLVSRVTNKGKILFANDAYLKFFGVNKDKVLGSNWHPLAHPDDLDMIYQRIKQMSVKTPVVVIQNRVYDSHKQIRWVEFINHGIFDAKGSLLEIQSVGRDITDAQVHVQEIDYIAHHDVLTGLANRLLIGNRLKTAIANAKKNNKKVAVCCIDLDHFKPINDDHGHSYGDEVLVEISKRMTDSTRASDTIGRLGGDEFVLIFAESVSEDDQKSTIARLLVDICSPIKLSNGIIVSVSASAGVSSYPKDSDVPDMLLRLADERMYQAKTTGRNKVVY